MLELLKAESRGHDVITVGSSAGGYAAVLYGSLLKAKRIFAFNPQFEINSLLQSSTEIVNPLLFRLRDNDKIRRYYDLVPFLNDSPVYYFMSEQSQWDAQQSAHVGSHPAVRVIKFKTSHHGVPFPRVALKNILSLSGAELDGMNGKEYSPVIFSIRHAGLLPTILGSIIQGISYLRKLLKKIQ